MKRFIVITAAVALLLIAAFAGFFLGRGTHRPMAVSTEGKRIEASPQVYTCSMHPQVRLNKPGKCPICEMPLIPADSAPPSEGVTPSLSLSSHALAMAAVDTVPVAYHELTHNLRAVGKVQYNEASLATVTARIDGYAEKLFVNITGVDIEAGDHLVEIYSPELLVGQQELLIAMQSGDGSLAETARLKLRRWGLTGEQIKQLADSRKVAERATLYSPITGTVIEKTIVENSAFKAGDALYRIANLDTVWAYLDIYEFDLAWIRYGQTVALTAEAYPGRTFTGMVTFVEPVLNENTRTVRVPVHVENKRHDLKPGMFVSAVIRAPLDSGGRAAPTGVEGKFTCPMHPQVIQDVTGSCPMCGMALEQIPGGEMHAAHEGRAAEPSQTEVYACPMKCEDGKTYDAPGNCPVCQMKLERTAAPPKSDDARKKGLLAVPNSAVLDSGSRRIVYVEKDRGVFEPREVTLGPRSGDFFPVLKGLTEGERVAARGGFLIDSQFQVTGHPSLFYPGGLQADMGHAHGAPESIPAADTPAEPATVETPADSSAAGHNH
ncbi:MAG: efflux RND transporter periplasmic adaptor subunit [Thermodesulfobacteriota bacterium]